MSKLMWVVESLEHRDVPSTVTGNLWPAKIPPVSTPLIGEYTQPNSDVYPPDEDGPITPPPSDDGGLIGGPTVKPIPDPWTPPVG
jgi:hypothetical protein